MKVHKIFRQQTVPISMEEAWTFFSSPHNLQKITPPQMNFKILTSLKEGEMYEGMKINYIVSPLLNIPLKWETLISEVNKPYTFTDIQKKGPYTLWEHKHSFRPANGGTEVTDEVRYSLPLGILGDLVHYLMVKKQLKNIFDFRENQLKKLFNH